MLLEIGIILIDEIIENIFTIVKDLAGSDVFLNMLKERDHGWEYDDGTDF